MKWCIGFCHLHSHAGARYLDRYPVVVTSLSSSDITSSTNTALNTAQSPTMILSFSRNVSYQPRPLPTLPFLCSRSLQLDRPGPLPTHQARLELESHRVPLIIDLNPWLKSKVNFWPRLVLLMKRNARGWQPGWPPIRPSQVQSGGVLLSEQQLLTWKIILHLPSHIFFH